MEKFQAKSDALELKVSTLEAQLAKAELAKEKAESDLKRGKDQAL